MAANQKKTKEKTYVYIDGFNLYYGCLRHTNYKWLNLEALCSNLLKENEIVKIKYFTARVSPRVDDEDAPLRQSAYLKALETLDKVECYFGHFKQGVKPARLVEPLITHNGQELESVKVLKTEEKGSDVNLACHLLMDAFSSSFDCAVVISNDSDLETPMRMVREKFRKKIGLINPHYDRNRKRVEAFNSRVGSGRKRKFYTAAQELMRQSDFFKVIREGLLQISQFPAVIECKGRKIHKPEAW
ncbi:MAG: NYN domain-containing protein [Bradymonadales bacterium]|nr:MAG: NYN domain-containing protein [Bradymonadales bacterium]